MIHEFCCQLYYECAAQVTMPAAANNWYLIWYTLGSMVRMILSYKPSISLHIQVPDMDFHKTYIKNYIHQDRFLINDVYFQGFPIDSHTFMCILATGPPQLDLW